MSSKTIILSKQDKSSRGILTLYFDDELLKCKLRLYNTPNLNSSTKLGLYHQDEVYSANLLQKNGVYESSFVGDFDLNKDFYCALVDTEKENQVLLSGGTYSGYFFNEDNIFETKKEYLDNTESCETECYNNCSKCKYKEFFFSQEKTEINRSQSFDNSIQQSKDYPNPINAINASDQKTKTISLESEILPDFNYLFEHYPIDENLSELIENSKFIKMNEGGSEYYLGAIYKDSNIEYICYAKKANYNDPVPQELGNHYQWLPTSKSDPLSDGYYIVFQDAHDLKIVELN